MEMSEIEGLFWSASSVNAVVIVGSLVGVLGSLMCICLCVAEIVCRLVFHLGVLPSGKTCEIIVNTVC